MKLRHIEVFHAVYLTGSASGAARSLNVSQPSISKIIKHTEDQLGFKLFNRVKGRLITTRKGIKLFEEIEPVFEKINDLKLFATKLAKIKKGRLRFAMTPAFGLDIVPKALTNFSKLHPNITIEITTLHSSQLSNELKNKTIDIGLVFDAPYGPEIVSSIIGKTQFICIAPINMDLKNKDINKILDINDLPLITLSKKSILGQKLNSHIAKIFQEHIKPHIIVDTYHIAKRLVQQNAGIAIIDKITAYSGDISNLQFQEINDKTGISIGLLSRINEPLTDYKQDFVGILQQQLQQHLQRYKPSKKRNLNSIYN